MSRNDLVLANMGLVRKAAHKYAKQHPDLLDDLTQAGTLGLIKGIDKFDPSRGVRLSTYVYPWILAGIIEELAKHVGHGIKNRRPLTLQLTLNSHEQKLRAGKGGEDPTDDELLHSLGPSWSLNELALARTPATTTPYPVSESDNQNNSTIITQIHEAVGPLPTPEQVLSILEREERLWDAICALPAPLDKIMMLRMQGLYLREVGKRLGVSRETVRLKEKEAMEILREHLQEGP